MTYSRASFIARERGRASIDRLEHTCAAPLQPRIRPQHRPFTPGSARTG
jgi:hypothetical protein